MSTEHAPIDTPEAAPRQSRFVLLLVLVLVVAIAGGSLLAFTQRDRLAGFAGGATAEEAPAAPVEYGQFLEVQGLIVNPAHTEGRRYLMVNVGLESAQPKVLEELEQKEVVVRDTLIKLLGHHTVEELAAIERRAQLKEELRQAVNGLLSKGAVDRIYFTQYVLQ